MTNDQAAALLLRASGVDGRKAGELQARMWGHLLRDVDFDDAMEALDLHYTSSDKWLMPVHVIDGTEALARRRAALIRQAELEAQIAAENPGVNAKAVLYPQPGELSGGPASDVAAALVPVRRVPAREVKRPAELLAESLAAAKREAAGTEAERAEALAAAKADHDVARAAAEAEVRRLEASREEEKADA